MLTCDILPLRGRQRVFAFHNVSQHYHLLSVPKWRAPNQAITKRISLKIQKAGQENLQCVHHNATGPPTMLKEALNYSKTIFQEFVYSRKFQCARLKIKRGKKENRRLTGQQLCHNHQSHHTWLLELVQVQNSQAFHKPLVKERKFSACTNT